MSSVLGAYFATFDLAYTSVVYKTTNNNIELALCFLDMGAFNFVWDAGENS